MCDFDKGFILCKCRPATSVTHHNKSKRARQTDRIEYVWTLNRFQGSSTDQEIGKYLFPINDLGSGLTTEFVLSEMNKKNCFDFDYTPMEGDNLVLNIKGSSSRMEFIFKNGQWDSDHYSPFDDEIEETHRGIVVRKHLA